MKQFNITESTITWGQKTKSIWDLGIMVTAAPVAVMSAVGTVTVHGRNALLGLASAKAGHDVTAVEILGVSADVGESAANYLGDLAKETFQSFATKPTPVPTEDNEDEGFLSVGEAVIQMAKRDDETEEEHEKRAKNLFSKIRPEDQLELVKAMMEAGLK